MLDLLYRKNIKKLPLQADLSESAFEAAAKELKLTDDEFVLHVPVDLYIEALKVVTVYLMLLDSSKKAKHNIRILERAYPDDWILEKGDDVVISPGV